MHTEKLMKWARKPTAIDHDGCLDQGVFLLFPQILDSYFKILISFRHLEKVVVGRVGRGTHTKSSSHEDSPGQHEL